MNASMDGAFECTGVCLVDESHAREEEVPTEVCHVLLELWVGHLVIEHKGDRSDMFSHGEGPSEEGQGNVKTLISDELCQRANRETLHGGFTLVYIPVSPSCYSVPIPWVTCYGMYAGGLPARLLKNSVSSAPSQLLEIDIAFPPHRLYMPPYTT